MYIYERNEAVVVINRPTLSPFVYSVNITYTTTIWKSWIESVSSVAMPYVFSAENHFLQLLILNFRLQFCVSIFFLFYYFNSLTYKFVVHEDAGVAEYVCVRALRPFVLRL